MSINLEDLYPEETYAIGKNGDKLKITYYWTKEGNKGKITHTVNEVITDEEYQSIIDSVTEEGYEVQTTDLASEWAYSSYLLQDRDEAIEHGYLIIYCEECCNELRYDCDDYDVPICDSCLEKKE